MRLPRMHGRGVTPLYESQADASSEREVANLIEHVTGWSMFKLDDRRSCPDWIAVDQDTKLVTAIIEIKVRTNKRHTYRTYMVDQSKWETVRRMARVMCVPGLIVVGFTDDVCWIDTSQLAGVEIELGGRNDRNDPNDIDWLYHVRSTRLKSLQHQPPHEV